jgi:hypothetical protein
VRKQELKIQQALCQYVRTVYPDLIFRSDGAGLKLPIGQAKQFRSLQTDDKYPDWFLAVPAGIYHGMYLEIKARKSDLYCKNGDYRQSLHIIEQIKCLDKLVNQGYYATFAVGIDSCIEQVVMYINSSNRQFK